MPVYKEIYDGPPRGYTGSYSKKRYIAIHNTSNDAPARNEASYAKRRTDSVSSHYYVDGTDLIQSLNTDYRAWHAGSSTGNTYAIAYEIVGTNSKSREWWLKNVDWDALAKSIARDMKHFGIENRRLTASQMKDGKSTGIVTHDDMRRAWGGTTHTDPGSNFPMDHLMAKVNTYLNGDDDDVSAKDVFEYEIKNTVTGKEDVKFQTYVQSINRDLYEVKKTVEKLAATPPGSVAISDEQLERVLRKVLGSVDNVQ